MFLKQSSDYIHTYDSPLGKIVIGSDGRNIIGLWFDQCRYFESTLLPERIRNDELEIFKETDQWLDLYFNGNIPDFMPSILVRGTIFEQRICRALMTIPYGETVSYGQLAEKAGMHKSAARSVGTAVGRNPVSILIPCHRVIGSDGSLCGYSGGLERKRELLNLEKKKAS